MNIPDVSFEHVFRLSDDTGLLEHAKGALPRRERGYCVDDVARGLLALSRQPNPTADEVDLATCYLTFVAHAQDTRGACHNRLDFERRWTDRAGTGDWWGRAVWALGAVVSGKGPRWQRDEALDRFSLSTQCRSQSPRALAFATLGAAEVAATVHGHIEARRLLEDALGTLMRPRADEAWPWPEPRLAYANASVAEALLAAGSALGDDRAVDDGLSLLSWLVEVETIDDHFSVVPAGGWALGESRPGFDQQPIEVAALADACARAFVITGENRWQIGVARCVAWFLGSNDSNVVMHDPDTGGGYDGLTSNGPNTNQGAESTLACLLTLQHGRHMTPDQQSTDRPSERITLGTC